MSDIVPSELSLIAPSASPDLANRRTEVVTDCAGLPLLWQADFAQPQDANLSDYGKALKLKRGCDFILALVALVALIPLLGAVVLSIKLSSPGPVLFRQQREGLKGQLFNILKFRSMSTALGDPTGKAQTSRNDARVTPVGRFIRRTSIDELPQLFNVLFGHMSLVGPRPHVPDMLAGSVDYRQLVPYYDQRLTMRPGLTGWAQCNGLRGPTNDAALAIGRIDFDVAYIQNFSLWLDMRILGQTLIREFVSGSGH